jgi:beta-glucosidase
MDGAVAQTLSCFAKNQGYGTVFIWYYDPEAFQNFYPQIVAGLGALNSASDGFLQTLPVSSYVLSGAYEFGPLNCANLGLNPFKPLVGEAQRSPPVAAPATAEEDLVDLVLGPKPEEVLELQARSRKFLWGAGTSAFQVEGNLAAGGRGASIWDAFLDPSPANMFYPDLACNSYYQFRDDIDLLVKHKAKAYRFSIAWSRIIPLGTLYTDAEGTTKDMGRVNAEGVAYYNAVIDYCLSNQLQPVVTLYHWDLPAALQTAYSGWLGTAKYTGPDKVKIVADFVNYTEVCFREFGRRGVKFWATINEPQTICVDSYEYNWYAPAVGTADGVSIDGKEYTVGRNLLLAHAHAYRLYHESFVEEQKGAVGIVCNMDVGLPFNLEPQNVAAAQRSNEFWGGWFWDPIFFGQYPASMLEYVDRARLPRLTEAESRVVRGTADVFFWNTYSTNLIQAQTFTDSPGWAFDSQSNPVHIDAHGFTIGIQGESTWLHSVPYGAGEGLKWIQNRYSRATPSAPGEGAPGVGIRLYVTEDAHTPRPLSLMVTENGFDVPNEDITTPKDIAVDDPLRWRDYYVPYLKSLHTAAKTTGTTFSGYFAWSLLDNLEWSHGFNNRFGLSYINFMDTHGNPITSGGQFVRLERVPKKSFEVLSKLLS